MNDKEVSVPLRPQSLKEQPQIFWCGFRVVLLLGLIASVSIYTVGSILTGIAFHSWNYDVRCEVKDADGSLRWEMFSIVAPMDVVGPSMMAFGGGVFLIIFIEWFFIKPFATYLVL